MAPPLLAMALGFSFALGCGDSDASSPLGTDMADGMAATQGPSAVPMATAGTVAGALPTLVRA